MFLVLWRGEGRAQTPSLARQSGHWGWQLPQKLSDRNTTVRFEVDSTWHLIKGTTSGVDGAVWLSDPKNDLSVKATINFPVARLSTGGEMRDERLREVMDEEHSRYVSVSVDALLPACTAQKFHEAGECDVTVMSKLSIRSTERAIELNGKLKDVDGVIELSGKVQFQWSDFGVEDPSILVAKLAPDVVVEYSVRIPKGPATRKVGS
jgi:polyisoprenoid-binding protein YceI